MIPGLDIILGGATWDGVKWTSASSPYLVSLQPSGGWASGYKPYKLKIEFTGATSTYVGLYNTDNTNNLFDGDEQFFSGVPKIINNYNNLDLNKLDIYNWDSGVFDVTNIEFLEA